MKNNFLYFYKLVSQLLVLIFFAFSLVACGNDLEGNTISIEFVSASPNTLTLRGTGGSNRSEISTVTFRIKDPEGFILTDQIIRFSLSTSVGGITLFPETAISDNGGLVSTVVQAGSIPTAVRVIATIPGTSISTTSDQLAISSGIPDQDSFSLGASIFNPEAWSYNGEESEIGIRLGDIFNNAVPQGTSVSFTTEGGLIQGSCQTNANSACSVIWTSQNPRPADGRISILATALGQESFTDNNGNGLFDTGDTFVDLPEAYRDDNGNGSYDLGEFFEDINNNGLYSAADGLYNGNSCAPGYSLCSTRKNIHVSGQVVLVMSSSFATITTLPAGPLNVAGPITLPILVTIEDINGNSMPGNTSIAVTTTNGTIENADTLPTTIPSGATGPISFNVLLTGDTTSSTGLLTIIVTTPKSNLSSTTITVND